MVAVEVTRTTPYEDLPTFCSVAEVARILDLTPWTIYQLVAQGKIPHRRFGKTILIPKTYVDPEVTQAVTP